LGNWENYLDRILRENCGRLNWIFWERIDSEERENILEIWAKYKLSNFQSIFSLFGGNSLPKYSMKSPTIFSQNPLSITLPISKNFEKFILRKNRSNLWRKPEISTGKPALLNPLFVEPENSLKKFPESFAPDPKNRSAFRKANKQINTFFFNFFYYFFVFSKFR
jgi:hypothetical protein